MTLYEKLISEATGRTASRDLAEIETCMRKDIFHSTLDWQTRGQLIAAAREGEMICSALGLVQ